MVALLPRQLAQKRPNPRHADMENRFWPIKTTLSRPCLNCACALFGQAFFIVFIPLFAYAGLRHLLNIPPKGAFGAALIWLILPWGFALFHPDRQFLYDFLAGTRLVDLNQKKTNE